MLLVSIIKIKTNNKSNCEHLLYFLYCEKCRKCIFQEVNFRIPYS